ncbi:hypothetical protein K1719_002710 [Acacia pycnantha]|nr:hypothetical protein K1719_002710 [Acacia pycnantha]
MHVEKNVCDSIVGTLLNIQGSSKDGVKARLDLQAMGIREDLHPRPYGKRTCCAPASHTLSKDEKRSFCECLHDTKVPSGYSSNFKRLVSMKDLKLVGQKSHDCHVLMQQLLLVAIRGIAEYDLRVVLTRLCFFFNAVCSKVFEIEKLDELENEGYLILCPLEKLFVPTFFDIMVHLIVHLVREIRGHGILSKLFGQRHIGLPKRQLAEGGRQGASVKSVDRDELSQVHLYILNNVDEVQASISAHKEAVRKENHRMTEQRLIREHNITFANWFKQNESMHFASSKDKRPKLAVMPYYGVIEEIWEVDYVKVRFSIFKCKWVNVNNGVQIDRLGFTLVDVNSRSFGDESFIMAEYAKQVFYITDQENKMWSVALQGKRDMNQEDEADNEPGIRNDHQEGIWEDITL